MADVTIAATGSTSAPLSYTVAGAQEIIIRSLFASFDGTGAAGAFLPCVQVVSPAGQVVIEAITDASVAAGSSADVTFAPFLKGAAAASTAGAGLPNAVMKKSNTQTINGNSITQVTLDSSTFATTDSSIFTASGSNVVIHKTGLYAAYINFVDDNLATNPTTTQFYPKWLGGVTNPNNPWQLAVPRIFNVNGPAGLLGSQPAGGGVADSMDNWSVAYVSEVNATVGAWMATLSASSITTSTCLLVVAQLQSITAATLAAFPSYPL